MTEIKLKVNITSCQYQALIHKYDWHIRISKTTST